MATVGYPKSGKSGKPSGFRTYTKGIQVKEVTPEFYDAQGSFAKDEEAERMDQYAKPGTSAKARAKENYEYTFPSSRYRSRRP